MTHELSLTALVRSRMRVGLRHPATYAAALLAMAAGAIGAMVPTGFRALEHGAGLGSGLHYGLLGAAAIAPVVTVLLVSALVAGDDDIGVRREHALAGVGTEIGTIASTVAAGCVAVATLGLAAVTGMAVGAADALRQGTPLLTSVGITPVAVCVAVCCWFAVVAGGLSAATRRSLAVSGLLLGGGLLFFVALMASRDATHVRSVLELTPYAPFWSLAYSGDSSLLALPMSAGAIAAGLIGWPVVTVAAGAVASRRPVG